MFKKLFAVFGLIGVILSAFGSHYLKGKISDASLQTWSTASSFLFIHVLIGLYSSHFLSKKRSSYFFMAGIFLFSGSLYLLCLTNFPAFGFITPMGGLSFILGWLLLAWDLI